MTKIEATKEIDRLLGEEKVNEAFEKKLSDVKEPKEVDTDDIGIDEEGLI